MRIGVDIDGVLINDDDYILAHGTKFCMEKGLDFYEDALEYETRKFAFHNDLKLMEEYRLKYWWDYLENAIPRLYASDILKKLKNEDCEIYIITSRHFTPDDTEEGLKAREWTKNWLHKNNIPYDGIYFVYDKVEIIEKLRIDVMIEDSPKTIPRFVNYTHVFCYDTRYNTEMKLGNMTRVYSWYDIYDKLKKFNK